MEEANSQNSFLSIKRIGKSFSRLDTLSKDGSTMGGKDWRKRYRSSHLDNLHIVQHVRSGSIAASVDSDQSDTFSDVSDGSNTNPIVRQKGGKFVFQSHTSIEHIQDYLLLDSESNVEDVVKHMTRQWKLPVPKVVLSLISNVDYFIMPNESILQDLELGIMQCARMTKMWILTDGLNHGASRIIGEAVAHEKLRYKLSKAGALGEEQNEASHIAAIGVVSTDQLSYGNLIEEFTDHSDEYRSLTLQNVGDDRRELNPHHSHSLLLSSMDTETKEATQNIRYNLEAKLSQVFNLQRRERKPGLEPTIHLKEDSRENMTTPVVGLMLQGGPGEIERVLWQLKKNIPVVVIARKDYASGLLALAYKECLRGDSSRVEQILKPQLMSRVKEAFPEYCGDNELLRQQVRDRILECAKIAIQSDRQLLFLVESNSLDEDLKDLNTFILAAVFSTQRGLDESMSRESINTTLRLALRWNRVDFVAKKILNPLYLSRFRVRDDLFIEALLLKDREPFIELFFDMGFLLQRLVTYEQVLKLFEASLNEEFFVTICLQNILLKKTIDLGSKFMHETNCELNKLLCALSGLKGLVDPSQLLLPQTSNKTPSNVLEKRALMTILYWAVLTNRKGLVKVLWKRSAEPIAVALVISNIYHRMSKFWIKDIDLKTEIKQNAIEFGDLAIRIMDLTFNDSRLLAFHSLTNPIAEFNNLNVVDLALIGNNIFFIAHPCCQRSMRERWFGNIKIKSYGTSFFNVPVFLKLYLCLLLVFPMYFWISFKPVRRAYVPLGDDDDEKEYHNKSANNTFQQIQDLYWTPRRGLKNDAYSSPNIFMKIYYLWTAPITKFWVNQFFVLAYLLLYAIAVMLPYCGNPWVNWGLCGWTTILIFENISRLVQRIQKSPTLDTMWPVVTSLAEVATVCVLLVHLLTGSLNFMTYKLLMALSMLAIYFCALRDMLTASPKLGPMLVNITELTRKDMINWIRLWMMCLISGGLAINAVIYPAQPFSIQSLGRALFRASLGIWLTDIDDLDGDSTCSSLYDTEEISHTCNASSISPFALKRLENCPYPSMAGYVMVIQYLMITRLVFYTLMFAMFSVTINRTQIRSVELWKYQFQSIVTDFESRHAIPPPLNIITYPFRLSYFLGNVALEIMLECSACCRDYQNRKDQSTSIPYNQWKSYLAQVSRQEEVKEDKVNDIISKLEEESATQQVAIKHLTDHLVHIERHQTMTAVYLEDLKKRLEMLDPKVRAHTQHGVAHEIHSLARQTPYPGTEIERFPLLDKDVPWEISYEAYDPATYSKPVEEFPTEQQTLVDIDILSLPMVGGQYQTTLQITDADGNTLDPNPRTQQVDIVHNAVQTLVLPNGLEVTINRKSYITDNDGPLMYDLDASGVPINPMGRTGLRGRGLLPRWGPNHWIKAVISRFNSMPGGLHPGHSSDADVPNKFLEILARTNPESGHLSLIGAPVEPNRSPYSTLCDMLTEVYPDTSTDHGANADREEMIHTFSKFASHIYGKKSKAAYATYGYSAFLVYRGYEDSTVNTDNAWQESEIFNFHYKHRDGFDTHVKVVDTVGWHRVTDQLSLGPSDLAAVKEAEKIRTRTV